MSYSVSIIPTQLHYTCHIAVTYILFYRRLHCKSNSLHINLFMAFILRSVLSLLKHVLFVEGLGLEKDVTRLSTNQLVFKNNTDSVGI